MKASSLPYQRPTKCRTRYHAQRYPRTGDALIAEAWTNDAGELTRPFGPALLERLESGTPLWEEWWLDGRPHRDGGKAATINYDECERGAVRSEEYWVAGELHRIDGPARVWFDPASGTVENAEWWIRGVQIDPHQMTQHTGPGRSHDSD